ncbi:hypothetical protein BDW22DRAFT_1399341 [Trametopsis cervina]|nr:hypothetical protein BDW22DRAFT_1399341 [Trametopsis cervina]
MSARTKPSSLATRRPQVYVEIPLSPHHSVLSHSSKHVRWTSADVKKNATLTPLTPLRTSSQANMSTLSSSSSSKRKLSDDDNTSSDDVSKNSNAKKVKLSTSAPQPTSKANVSTQPKEKKDVKETQMTETAEYPNGFFYCHQCCRKRDMSYAIRCTWKRKSKGKVERCKLRYCKACLKNRYQEDMDMIKSRGVTGVTGKQREQHVLAEGYYYQCPRCRDDCNCRFCRKAKGLEPTGNFNAAARKAEKTAAAAEKAKSSSLSSASTKSKVDKSSKVSKSGAANGKASSSKLAKPKVKPPKPLPKPIWTRIATDLTLTDAETRIHIREFVVRFSSVLQINHSQLEELEEISGDNLGETSHWDDSQTGDAEIISWVTDLCARSVIQGLLEVLASGAQSDGDHEMSKTLKEAARNVKSSGANLSRAWNALASMRDALGPRASLRYSDPLPPPASTVIRTTRQNKDSDLVHIANSAQLVPVIADLIEAAISCPAIRDALESGSIEEKEYAKLAREAIVAENNRWKEARDAKDGKKGDTKALRERHQRTLEDLEYAHRLLLLRCIPRLSPLGRDADGRVYYAMSPGVGETDASLSLLKGKDARVKIGRKKGGFMEDDRREMERWSWFIAVYGRKPEDAIVAKRENEEDEDEDVDSADEDDEACWWGFWQPQEVTKIAEWLAIKSGLGDDVRTDASEASDEKANGSSKGKGAKGRTSVASSSLSSLSSSHISSLSDISDMSDVSDDQGRARINFERPLGHKRELQHLVHGLNDFADILQWRIRRAETDTLESQRPQAAAIPASRFYS